MHTVFALLCFVVVIHGLIFPYPSGLLHWHCGNLTIAPVPAKQPWWIWINTSCEFIMNDCITTTKQSTTKPCAYFLGYTVGMRNRRWYGRIPGDTLLVTGIKLPRALAKKSCQTGKNVETWNFQESYLHAHLTPWWNVAKNPSGGNFFIQVGRHYQ